MQRFLHLPQALFLALLLSLGLTACSDGSDSRPTPPPEVVPDPEPELELSFSDSPVDLGSASARFSADIRYGDGERNLFDIFLPDSDEPTPLVIYIHGGGFTGGDKTNAYGHQAEAIAEFLEQGIAYASINYYLLVIENGDEDGVVRSMSDSARALQFMRYYHHSLNIDPDNVALYGGSAGAGTSLWLGTHDDMADSGSDDPVLRESTRVKAVGALATQATYDLVRWEEVLLPVLEPFEAILGGTDIVTVAEAVGATQYLETFLGIDDVAEIEGEENQAYRENVDMLGLMDSGDAPIYVFNRTPSPDDLIDLLFHHGLHAVAVLDRAEEVGLHSVGYVEDDTFGREDPSGEDLVSFLSRHIR